MINSKLENLIVLKKSKKRFNKTNFRNIREISAQDRDHVKSVSYVLSFDHFQMEMHYYLDKTKEETLSLGISVLEGEQIISFDNSNPDYAPILWEIYECIKNKKKDYEEREDWEKEKKQYQESKRLIRRL